MLRSPWIRVPLGPLRSVMRTAATAARRRPWRALALGSIASALGLPAAAPAQPQNAVWFSDGSTLYQADAGTRTLVRSVAAATTRISADSTGGVWLLTNDNAHLKRFDAAGIGRIDLGPAALGVQNFSVANVASDPKDGSAWVAVRTNILGCVAPSSCPLVLRRVGADGQLLAAGLVSVNPASGFAATVDLSGQLWIAAEGALVKVSPLGAESQRWALPASVVSTSAMNQVVVDPLAAVAWYGYAYTGTPGGARVLRVDLSAATPAVSNVGAIGSNPDSIAVEPLGGHYWTASRSTASLNRYLASGTADSSIALPASLTRRSVEIDPVNNALWVGGSGGVQIFSGSGQPLGSLPVGGVTVLRLSSTPFRPVPQLALVTPAPQAATNDSRPAFVLACSSRCNGLPCTIPDPRFGIPQFGATLDGAAVAGAFVYDGGTRTATYVPPAPLGDGTHAFAATVTDRFGQASNAVSAALRIDTVAPQVQQLTPPDGSRTAQAAITISGQLSEPGVATLGSASQSGPAFSFPRTLAPGANPLTLTLTDEVANVAQLPLTYHYLTLAITAPSDGASVAAGSVAVTGTFTGPADAAISVNSVTAALNGGSFSAVVPLVPGSNVLSASLLSGGVSVTRQVTVTQVSSGGGGGVLNPPPLDPSIPTTVHASTAFLYTGPGAVQTGVAPGTIEPRRAAVLRGRVLQRGGSPLPGVTVNMSRNPQYGQTLTRADGRFDLALNGGGAVTLHYAKPGYLPVQRSHAIPWQDFVVADDVVMLPLDGAVTPVVLNGTQPLQTARGGSVTDASGTRRATLMFPQGTTATMALPDGTVRAMPTLSVRATEYTVGSDGAKAMPGSLPPTSGYTYAVELSADEAIAAGASRVRLSQAVPFYVENFLNFPVGGAVPVGYYDQDTGTWVPAPNGRVVKVLSVSAGQAAIDLDGDGQADSGTALSSLGITTAELQALASLYAPGTSLWRVPVDHFTPWDCNWPFGPPAGASAPPPPPPRLKDEDCCPTIEASLGAAIFESTNQTAREGIPVADVPFDLVYSSSRVPGRSRQTISIPLTGPQVPPDATGVRWHVTVAGQKFSGTGSLAPNQTADFAWDGKDAYGRAVTGAQPATVQVEYTYRGVYQKAAEGPASFGMPSGVPITGSLARQEISLWQQYGVLLGTGETPSALGGWTPGIHHRYDPAARVLQLGNGSRQSNADAAIQVVTTTVGKGGLGNGDGTPAVDASIGRPKGLAVEPDGSLLFVETPLQPGQASRIRKVGPDGLLRTLVANPAQVGGSLLEGSPNWLASDGRGNVFYDLQGQAFDIHESTWSFAVGLPDFDGTHHVIKRDTQGNLGILAGNGPLVDNDGGLASQAGFGSIAALATDSQGNLFVAERMSSSLCAMNGTPGLDLLVRPYRVHKIDPEGRIHRVQGPSCAQFEAAVAATAGFSLGVNPPADYFFYSGPTPALSAAASLYAVGGLAVDGLGNIHIADRRADVALSRVSRLSPDGMLTRYAGTVVQQPWGNADGFSSGATLMSGATMTLTPAGETLIAEPDDARIRRIGLDTIVQLAAGTGSSAGEGWPATATRLPAADNFAYPTQYPGLLSMATNAGGEVFYSDFSTIRRIGDRLPLYNGSDIMIPSADGREIHHFTAEGRHFRTLESRTGAELFRFGYDAGGRLVNVTDIDNKVTTIERLASGDPKAIVSPFGHRTELTLDANGYLQTVTDPIGRVHQLTHDAGGLLATFRKPRSNQLSFAYEPDGRVRSDQNDAGGALTLTRSALADPGSIGAVDAFTLAAVTAQGRNTNYLSALLPTGHRQNTVTYPDGTKDVTLIRTDGFRQLTAADGSVFTSSPRPDPRLGLTAPLIDSTLTLPQGPSTGTTVLRSVNQTNFNDPFSLVTETTSTSVGNIPTPWTSVFSQSTRRTTTTSPMGRTTVVETDAAGRPTLIQRAGLEAINLAYDEKGRLKTATQGTGAVQRSLTLGYGADGYLHQTLDALNRSTAFDPDAAGQVRKLTLPDTEFVLLDYDDNGNLSGVTPPGRPRHSIDHNAVDLESADTPPVVPGVPNPATTTTYTPDRQPQRVTRPDGSTVSYAFNAITGKLETITPSAGAGQPITLTYKASTGQLETLVNADTTLTLGWNGPLPASETLSGAASGSVAFTYNSLLLPSQISVNGVATQYSYDNDGLMTAAGALSITPHEQHGLPRATTLGGVTTSQTYNGFGEPEVFIASFGGNLLYRLELGYDRAGRVVSKVEQVQGVTSNWEYGYDPAGRLQTVKLDGTQVARYGYDANGNRTTVDGDVVATFDDQDRLQAYGSASYAFGAAGDLKQVTAGGQTTSYDYDVFGNLRSVTEPATTITYKSDARGRRVAKLVNGTVVQRFVYQDNLRIAAELDGDNNLLARFVYAGRPNVPEYLVQGDGKYRLLGDHLGSVRLVVDAASGAVVQRLDYDAWGQVTLDSNPGFQPFGFAGGLYDRDTSLVRLGARDYEAAIGRWTKSDPIGLAGGINTYAYVGGNPISYIDPSGLVRYNAPPPRTVPVDGQTSKSLVCVETCLMGRTGNFNLDLLVTGGAEKERHSSRSSHYKGEACDVSTSNPVSREDMNSCAASCGFGGGQLELFPNNPRRDHWHLQLTPGNGVPAIGPDNGPIPIVYPK